MKDLRCIYSETKKLALTGSTGFVGKAIINMSYALDFKAISFLELPTSCVIIHCAADMSGLKESFINNVENDLVLIEDAISKNNKIIYLSTNNIYSKTLNCRVQDKPLMTDYYSGSKIVGEILLTKMVPSNYCSIRVADVFGVGQKHGNFFRSIENSIRTKSPINLMGSGLKLRSYIHVEELAKFLLFIYQKMLKNHDNPNIINCCYRDSLNLLEIADLVSKYAKLEIKLLPSSSKIQTPDIRTMIPGPFLDYNFLYSSFETALKSYITQVQNFKG